MHQQLPLLLLECAYVLSLGESSCEHTSLVKETAAAACINTFQLAPRVNTML